MDYEKPKADADQYQEPLPTAYLNSLEPAELPPHELVLTKNMPIMLMRNLRINEGLCNGTRLRVDELRDDVIVATIMTGTYYFHFTYINLGDKKFIGKQAHIPRIVLDTDKGGVPCHIFRRQFPVLPAFAMTINKSQGQTFEIVGVDLRTPVFSHGQLYVAFSRARRFSGLKVIYI